MSFGQGLVAEWLQLDTNSEVGITNLEGTLNPSTGTGEFKENTDISNNEVIIISGSDYHRKFADLLREGKGLSFLGGLALK